MTGVQTCALPILDAGAWRFDNVEIAAPRADPPGSASANAEQALATALASIARLDGQTLRGKISELTVIPLGETPPEWLTSWLRFAGTGLLSPAHSDPVVFPAATDTREEVAYQLRWLRSEFRQELCHVQQARWTAPLQPAQASLPEALAAQGVVARTHFAAHSLEWVSQATGELVRAERSAARETSYTLENVAQPELRAVAFRLRLAVTLRLDRLP